jgi:hypothetical protein
VKSVATGLFYTIALLLLSGQSIADLPSLRGWALAMGHHEEGIGQIRENLDALQVTGAEGARPYFLCLLAEAYMEAGRFDNG